MLGECIYMQNTKIEDFERKVAIMLLTELQALHITPERAAHMAKDVLAALPDNISEEEFTAHLHELQNKYKEIVPLVLESVSEIDKEQSTKLIDKVREEVAKLS